MKRLLLILLFMGFSHNSFSAPPEFTDDMTLINTPNSITNSSAIKMNNQTEDFAAINQEILNYDSFDGVQVGSVIFIVVGLITVFFILYLKRKTFAGRIGMGYLVMGSLLCFTVLLTLWQTSEIVESADRLRELRAPTAQNSLMLLNGVNYTLAALRGWVILADPKFKIERQEAWRSIRKSLTVMNELSIKWTNTNNKYRYQKVKEKLHLFRRFQDQIENIANTDNNIFSKKIMLNEIVPLYAIMDETIDKIILAESDTSKMSKQKQHLVKEVSNVKYYLYQELLNVQRYIFSGQDKFRVNLSNDISRDESSFNYISGHLVKFSKIHSINYFKLMELRKKLLYLIDKAIESRASIKWNMANYLLESKAAPLAFEIKAVLSDMHENQNNLMLADFKETQKQHDFLEFIEWVLLIVGLMLSGVLGYFVTRSVTRPMSEALDVAESVAKGKFDFSINLRGSEEIVKLASALKVMTKSLKDMAESTKSVAAGNLDTRVRVKSDSDELALSINQMISALQASAINAKDQMAKLFDSQKRADSIVNLMFDGLVTIDPNGTVLSFNPAAVKMFGYTSEQVVGGNVRMLMPDPFFGEHDGYLKSYEKTGVRKILGKGRGVLGKRKDGSTFPLKLTVSEVEIGNKRMFIGTLRDTTESTQIENRLEKEKEKLISEDWLKTNLVKITEGISDKSSMKAMADTLLTILIPALDAKMGVFYVVDELDDHLNNLLTTEVTISLLASYAFDERRDINYKYRLGDRLVGQAALEQKAFFITDIPEDYLRIGSALGSVRASEIAVVPIIFESHLLGVIELACLKLMTKPQKELLFQVSRTIGVYINSIVGRSRSENMLGKLQDQAKYLEEQAVVLKSREEELKISNDELEVNANIAEKANKSKSEFLANMSHELRTPLNSLLILADDLSINDTGNLDEDQLESVNIIKNSGKDLLMLINEVLDLAKIESGKMEVYLESVIISDIASHIQQNFDHVATKNNLQFSVEIDSLLSASISTDKTKVFQILRNLLSNAFKFTHEGHVSVNFDHSLHQYATNTKSEMLAITVSDTGIGMEQDRLQDIFESFKQADSSTSREYGGTGLGLTISREFSTLLGGELVVESSPNEGSTFTLYLPLNEANEVPAPITSPLKARGNTEHTLQPVSKTNKVINKSKTENQIKNAAIIDDRDSITEHDNVILVIEDDAAFANILYRETHKKGAKCLIATDGESGLVLTKKFMPDAVIMDIELPSMSGLDVFDCITTDSSLSHIPVYFISISDDVTNVVEQGAIGYLTKPVSRAQLHEALKKIRALGFSSSNKILVIEDDSAIRLVLKALLEAEGFEVIDFDNAEAGYELLQHEDIEIMVLDIQLPGMSGIDLLDKISENEQLKQPPVMIYSGAKLSPEEIEQTQKYTDVFIKKNAGTPEHILKEVLKSVDIEGDKAPASPRKSERKTRASVPTNTRNNTLNGKHVLLVDDDTRNIFALSKMLKNQLNMTIYIADNGQKSLDVLADDNKIDIILMDIMMPVMDGYEAITRIRQNKDYDHIPIVAVTAKAMEADKKRCIEVGANDFVSKPIEAATLFDVMANSLSKEKLDDE